MNINIKEYEFHKNPCNQCKYIEKLENGVMKYACLGHKMQKYAKIILSEEYFYEPHFYKSSINNNRLGQLFIIAKPYHPVFLECYKKAISNIKENYEEIINIRDKEEYIKTVLLTTGPIHFTKIINTILDKEPIYILPSDRFCAGSGGIVPKTKNSVIIHKYTASWINTVFT